MTLHELTNRLFKRTASTNTSVQTSDNEAVVFVSDESNNWNKFVLLVSLEAEKPPSLRSSSFESVKTFQKQRTPPQSSMTTSQWNKLVLGHQSETEK